ncbi:hypothetical protein LX36DRAFT_658483 [Colletotrichum falcatum]|nr:hypothetical protein LX36DRAFT_658483 [Colletotrichum falcatum]
MLNVVAVARVVPTTTLLPTTSSCTPGTPYYVLPAPLPLADDGTPWQRPHPLLPEAVECLTSSQSVSQFSRHHPRREWGAVASVCRATLAPAAATRSALCYLLLRREQSSDPWPFSCRSDAFLRVHILLVGIGRLAAFGSPVRCPAVVWDDDPTTFWRCVRALSTDPGGVRRASCVCLVDGEKSSLLLTCLSRNGRVSRR